MSDDDQAPSLSVAVTPQRNRMPPSTTDLASVHEVLKNKEPLAGRRVMIPVTTQAFFEGHLRPPPGPKDADTTSSIKPRPSEERVSANLGDGHLADMSREEAADFIQRRIDAAAPSSAPSVSKPKKKSSLKQTRARPTTKSDKQQKQQPQPQPPVAQTVLPFFEIREELDAEGREVKAEAVNVAQETKALKDALRSQKDSNGASGGEETKGIHELIENIDIGVDENGNDGNVQEADDDDVEVQQHEPISDDKYNSLSARLDELARLEEDAGKNKNEEKSSRKRLQGKAWGKGFLSGSETTTSKKAAASSTSKKKKSTGGKNTGGWSRGFLNAEPKAENKSPPKIEPKAVSSDEPERQRKVAFGENEIKEIPRIGHNSVKVALQKPKPAAEPQEGELIAKDVFSGVVMERPKSTSISAGIVQQQAPVPSQVQQQQQHQQQQPKKKLSRFAQQRLEQRGGY